MNAVEFPIHRHPLNGKEFMSEESRLCSLCGETVKGSGYECPQCDFAAHIGCAENPPSVVIKGSKIHEHALTLLPRHVSFTCNVCGLSGDKSPYVCLECSFMTHKDCISFRRVIRVNRHDHRLTLSLFLGLQKWTCGVCRKSIEGRYGAYCCHRCDHYAVHTKCALRNDVWDGMDLEGIPQEEEEEDEEVKDSEQPFPLPDDRVIQHFAHPHQLRLQDYKNTDYVCSGCVLPIAAESFYKCDHELCGFFLHKRCANLPQKKTTFLHVHPLTLCTGDPNGITCCDACHLHFNGFSYRCTDCNIEFDIQCSSVTLPFEFYGHEHPLVLDDVPTGEIEKAKICNGCGLQESKYLLTCLICNVYLCVTCAVLPGTAKYKYDEHFLSIHTGLEDVTVEYLCDICENKIEEKGNYYKCFNCGPVLHTNCAVGSFRHMRPWLSFTSHGHEYQVVLNDWTSQLRCSQCLQDCNEPLLLMSTTTTDVTTYLCSSPCFTAYMSAEASLL